MWFVVWAPPPIKNPGYVYGQECTDISDIIYIRSESQQYTDSSKLDGRVGEGFKAEYPNNSPKQAFFHLGIYSTVNQAEVFAISEVAKNLLL